MFIVPRAEVTEALVVRNSFRPIRPSCCLWFFVGELCIFLRERKEGGESRSKERIPFYYLQLRDVRVASYAAQRHCRHVLHIAKAGTFERRFTVKIKIPTYVSHVFHFSKQPVAGVSDGTWDGI